MDICWQLPQRLELVRRHGLLSRSSAKGYVQTDAMSRLYKQNAFAAVAVGNRGRT